MTLIVVTGSQLDSMDPRELSERIVQGMMVSEIVDVVGIGAGIPCAIGGVNLSRNIAKFSLKSVTLDNIQIPVYGKQEAIFFELSREPEVISSFVGEFEAKPEQEKSTLTVIVFKEDKIPTITNQILYKLSKYPTIKVIAAGFTVITAVRAVLQVVTSGISLEPTGIIAVLTTSIPRKDFPSKKIPAIHIFLEKGQATTYPPRHAEVMTQVIQGWYPALGVVAIDSAGSFEQPPIKIVAAKKVEKQNYRALYLDKDDIEKYKKVIKRKVRQTKGKNKKKKLKKQENYREKISAALIFESMRTLVKHTDLIQIDKDFEGWREDMVRGFLERLFGKVHQGTPLSNPSIRFITDHCEDGKYIKEAHGKTQDAKHKKLSDIEKCPNLEKLLNFL